MQSNEVSNYLLNKVNVSDSAMTLSAEHKTKDLEPRLRQGLDALGLTLLPQQQKKLLSYLGQLIRWNKTFNLTAVRDPAEMVDRHLLDSLAVLPLITQSYSDSPIHLMDVGAGAGLPGIPIALVRPATSLTLVESNGKKAAFLRQCKIELGMASVQVCQSRVEMLEPETLEFGTPDLIISRAFRAIGEFLELVAPFVSSTTTVFAMKGPALDSELEQMAKQINSDKVSKQLLTLLGSHQMKTEVLALANIDATRQVAIFSAPSPSDFRPSAVFLQE